MNTSIVVNEWVRGAGVNERQGDAGGLEQASCKVARHTQDESMA